MDATTKSKTNKTSVALLAVAVIYGLFTILLFYSNFLIFPPTFDDIKYAVGFFYAPLVMVALALGALVLKFRAGSRKLSNLCAQLGLLLSGGLLAWWLAFESGFLPTIMLPVIFLAVVVYDLREKGSESINT
jgi:hypothetical protein